MCTPPTWKVESAVRLCPCVHVATVIREGEEEQDEALGGKEWEKGTGGERGGGGKVVEGRHIFNGGNLQKQRDS